MIFSNLHGNDVWRFQAFDCFCKMKIIDAKISLNLASSQINVKEQITPKMEKNWLLGPCVIRPFHFQFRKKMKFYFLFMLFMNSSRFFETKLPYCRKNTDILTTKLKILRYLT